MQRSKEAPLLLKSIFAWYCRSIYRKPCEKNVVAIVPAYLNDSQRKDGANVADATAGLNVMQIVNEPTAAFVFVYSLGDITDCVVKQNIFIFDLGNGEIF